jgi:uncharacterized protein (TIRG00374 family)
MNKKLLLLLDGLVSLLIMAGVLWFIGADKFIAELAGVNLFYVAVSIVFLLLMDFVMAYRIKLVLKENKVDVSYKGTFLSHMVGMLLSDFTPARSGYFATAAALSYNYKVPSEKAMVAILGPQTLDFIVKVIVGTISLLYLTKYVLHLDNGWFVFVGAGLMCVMIAVMVLLLFSGRFLRLFSFAERIPFTKRVYLMFLRMQENSHTILKVLPQLIALLLLSWSAKAISWYFVAKSLGITIDIGIPEVLVYYFIQPTLTILEFVPSPTIAGLGLSEGGGAVLLSVFGISAAKAASFVFLARIKTTFVNLIAVPETLKTAKGMKDDLF